MHHMTHTPPMAPMTFIPYYGYNPHIHIPSPPECYVLDLSKKRPHSPDYTYCYPSPKSSPTYRSSLTCCPQRSPVLSSKSPAASPHSPSSVSVQSETSEVSFQSDLTTSPKAKSKVTRPFKAMPKDSLSLALSAISHVDSTKSMIEDRKSDRDTTKSIMEDSVKAYAEFRQTMLQQICHDNGTNKNMRRSQNNGCKAQDVEYLEKRKKNNEAAKRSRDARRNKQDEIAIRVTFLEQENMMLQCKIDAEKEDLERLQRMATSAKFH